VFGDVELERCLVRRPAGRGGEEDVAYARGEFGHVGGVAAVRHRWLAAGLIEKHRRMRGGPDCGAGPCVLPAASSPGTRARDRVYDVPHSCPKRRETRVARFRSVVRFDVAEPLWPCWFPSP
jgi:hypothetical protein